MVYILSIFSVFSLLMFRFLRITLQWNASDSEASWKYLKGKLIKMDIRCKVKSTNISTTSCLLFKVTGSYDGKSFTLGNAGVPKKIKRLIDHRTKGFCAIIRFSLDVCWKANLDFETKFVQNPHEFTLQAKPAFPHPPSSSVLFFYRSVSLKNTSSAWVWLFLVEHARSFHHNAKIF